MENMTHLPYQDGKLISYIDIVHPANDMGFTHLRLQYKSSESRDSFGQRSLKIMAEVRHIGEGIDKHYGLEDFRKIVHTQPLNYQNESTVTKFHERTIEHTLQRVKQEVNTKYSVSF